MKILHYPLQQGYPEIDDDTLGIGAHTECLVFLTSFLLLLMSSVASRSGHQWRAGLL